MSMPTHHDEVTFPQYEFTPQQNRVIGQLAGDMNWVAVPLVALGVLYAIAGVVAMIQAITHRAEATFSLLWLLLAGAVAIFLIGQGMMTMKAAGSFRQIVDTRGQDINHLMDALEKMRVQYSSLAMLVKLYLAFTVISLIAGLIALLVEAVRG